MIPDAFVSGEEILVDEVGKVHGTPTTHDILDIQHISFMKINLPTPSAQGINNHSFLLVLNLYTDTVLSDFMFDIYTGGMIRDSPLYEGTSLHVTTNSFSQPPLIPIGHINQSFSIETERADLEKTEI